MKLNDKKKNVRLKSAAERAQKCWLMTRVIVKKNLLMVGNQTLEKNMRGFG